VQTDTVLWNEGKHRFLMSFFYIVKGERVCFPYGCLLSVEQITDSLLVSLFNSWCVWGAIRAIYSQQL